MSKMKQPEIAAGTEFTGWATFNWGICHQRVYRTRKEAQQSCTDSSTTAKTWDDVKDHFKVVKVKCTVL